LREVQQAPRRRHGHEPDRSGPLSPRGELARARAAHPDAGARQRFADKGSRSRRTMHGTAGAAGKACCSAPWTGVPACAPTKATSSGSSGPRCDRPGWWSIRGRGCARPRGATVREGPGGEGRGVEGTGAER
jgi:hypothetical protein